MANLKTWSVGIKRKIDEQKEQIYKSDYKFYKVDRLEEIAERLDEFSDECAVCTELKTETEDIVNKLPEYLKGSLGLRREYEKRSDALAFHLRKAHNLYPRNYFTSVYALAGFAGGIVLGGGIGLLAGPDKLFGGLIIGFLIGLFTGYIMGTAKDKKQRKDNLIL